MPLAHTLDRAIKIFAVTPSITTMLDIKIQNTPSPRICELQGRLDSSTAVLLEQQLNAGQLLSEGVPLVVDCGALEYVSSAGLRVILLLVRKASQAGLPLAFVALRSSVRSVLEISGMLGLLKVHEAVDAAVREFAVQG